MAITRLRGDTSPDLAAVRDELHGIAARLDAVLAKLDEADAPLVDRELQKLSGGGADPLAESPGSDAALIAQEIAMSGGSRIQARDRLREIFGKEDFDSVLDAVYRRPS